jgi:hypothetical protein
MSNIYVVGPHVINVFDAGAGWRISVNGTLVEETFATRSEAWQAGLAEVDRLDRRGGEPPPPGPAVEPAPT